MRPPLHTPAPAGQARRGSARAGLFRAVAAALVCLLLGLGAAVLLPAPASAAPVETPARVMVEQGPPQTDDPVAPSSPTPTPTPTPSVPAPTTPGPDAPDPAEPTDTPDPAVPDPDEAEPSDPVPPLPEAESSCAIWDIGACITEAITGLLRAAVTDLVNPALELLSDTLLQTPQPSDIPGLLGLWEISWQIAVAFYGIVIALGAVIVMSHQTVQTRYGLREILPRLFVGFIAAWLSLPLAEMAVQIANAVSDALLGPADDETGMGGLVALVRVTLSAGIGSPWLILGFGLMIAVALVALLCGYVLRVVATILLVAAAPLVVMWHGLPQTEGVARWWWRAMAGVLSIQIIQALVLAVGVQILLPDPADTEAGTAGQVLGFANSGWVLLLVLGALLWVLVKVPGWVWSMIRGGGGGRSLLGTAVRGAILWKTGGLLRGALAGSRSGTGSASSARTSRGPSGAEGEPDPYARTPEFAGGQLGLPFTGLRRRRATPATPRGAAGNPASAGRSGTGRDGAERRGEQLALPLGQDWPENRPVLGRDGQWRLPITAERRPAQPRAGFAPPATAEPSARPGPGQLRFPTSGHWPEQRPLLGRDGQYRLPIPVTRRPAPPSTSPAAPVSPPPAATSRAGRARQLSFDDLARDLDPFRGNRPLAGGQYPLPLPGLTRQPPPATRPRTASAPVRPARQVPGQTRLPVAAPRPATPDTDQPRTAQPRPAQPRTPPPPAQPSPTPPRERRAGPRRPRRPGQENPS